MHMLNIKTALLALAAVRSAFAHSGFSNFFVDGKDQGDDICVRMNPDAAKWTFPLQDLTSTDLACGFNGTQGVPRVCPIGDGSTLTFEWRLNPTDASKGVIDPSHKGPCAVYMKKVDSAIDDPGAGDGWFKLWDQGYDTSSGQGWCTLNLIAGKGLMTVDLPKGLVGGYYLIRPELLALHITAAPQYYAGCAQVFLESTGTLEPESTVSIPGYVSMDDAADTFNIYQQPMPAYPIPGPPVANFTSSGKTTQTKQSEGLKPQDCILESGTWCGVEVPDYSDETGCWDAGQDCWDQNTVCWSKAPATGGTCKIWNDKCTDIDNQCTKKNFVGPPNKGKDLTPAKGSISPPAPLGPTHGGNEATYVAPTKATTAKSTTSASTAAGADTTVAYTTPADEYSTPVSTPVKVAASSSTPAAAVPASSMSYAEGSSTLAEAVPTSTSAYTYTTSVAAVPASSEGACGAAVVVTVTHSEAVTITVYPTSDVDVNAAAVSTPAAPVLSSTPAAPVISSAAPTYAPKKHYGGHHWHGYPFNGTFHGTKYAMPSGFTKLPKNW